MPYRHYKAIVELLEEVSEDLLARSVLVSGVPRLGEEGIDSDGEG